MLWVRAWPLEIVNGRPLDPHFIAEEVDDIRTQVAPDLFGGFREDTFPATSLPALALAAAAHEVGPATGERVSLALRDLLFERGVDVGDEDVLRDVAAEHGVEWAAVDPQRVVDDHAEGVRRQVVGSPHFFTSAGGFFCPALQVSRDEAGQLQVVPDAEAFEQFLATCFA